MFYFKPKSDDGRPAFRIAERVMSISVIGKEDGKRKYVQFLEECDECFDLCCTPEIAIAGLEAVIEFIKIQTGASPQGTPLQRLMVKHGISGHPDAGGAALHHPVFGPFRICACNEQEDYNDVVTFLRQHGVEP